MLTDNGINHAVPNTGYQRLPITLAAQRRPNMEAAVETGQGLLGEHKLVHGHIGGYRNAAAAGFSHLRASDTAFLRMDQPQVPRIDHAAGQLPHDEHRVEPVDRIAEAEQAT